MDSQRRRRGRGGTRARARQRDSGIDQIPWRTLTNTLPHVEILRPEQIEAIHQASLTILEEMGIEVMSPLACEILAKAGAEVERSSGLVRFDRGLIEAALATAPAGVTLTPRNPERRITLGGDHLVFGLVNGPAFIHDREQGRRPARFDHLCDLLRLAQSLNIVHILGNQPVAATDLPPESRHLDTHLAHLTLTDRVFGCMAVGAERVRDALDMVALARGLDREGMAASPSLLSVISMNSPRRLDGPLAEGLIEMATWGQAVVVTPFTLMGAMTPVTLAAALTQQNAEALAGIALAQIVRPGAPVVYGAFTSNVDLKSGAPAFGTPEYARATFAAGQLARRYGLAYRSSNANASNAVDAQSAYESEMSLWSSVLGGAHLIHHGAGWLEGGLTASFEKVILDAEMLQMMAATLEPIPVDEGELALAAIREVAPGGHFFGSGHTLARYETAFYRPLVSDWRSYEAWEEAGSRDSAARAHEVWKALLAAYAPPPLDPGIREALEAFVEQRKGEIAARGP